MAIKLYTKENKLMLNNLYAAYKISPWFHMRTIPNGDFKLQYQKFNYWLWTDYNVWADQDQHGTYVEFDTDERRVEFLLKWL